MHGRQSCKLATFSAARVWASSRLLRARKWGRIMSMRKNSGPKKVMRLHPTRPLLRTREMTVKQMGGGEKV
jgi:hypothetical protein